VVLVTQEVNSRAQILVFILIVIVVPQYCSHYFSVATLW